MAQPDAAQALRALEPLEGEWTLAARGPDGVPWPGEGHSIVEWHESRAHLVQRTVVDGAPASISVMGCDAANGTYTQLYSDDRGVCRIYEMRIGGGEWVLERRGDPFPQRFVGSIDDDGRTITGRWEKAEGGGDFTVDFHLTYRRVGPPAA